MTAAQSIAHIVEEETEGGMIYAITGKAGTVHVRGLPHMG